MSSILYYYSGAGNSLWVARTLAAALGQVEVAPIADWQEDQQANAPDVLGIVFPVFIWGVPRRVIRFVNALKNLGDGYAFAVATNGGQVANTLVQLEKLFRKRGGLLSAGFDITMPSSYIPWGGPGPEEERRKLFDAALTKLLRIAACVQNREKRPVEKGPLWQRAIFSPIYKLTFGKTPGWDKEFWVDDKCSRCGLCAKVCPSRNIALEEGKPVWNHACEQCFACLQWCPKEAIQYGKKTPRYERYRHPEVRLQDMLRRP